MDIHTHSSDGSGLPGSPRLPLMYTRILLLSQFPYIRLSVKLYQNKGPMLPLQKSEEWATLSLEIGWNGSMEAIK